MRQVFRVVGLAFVLIWVAHTIAVSGAAMIAIDYGQVLKSSPIKTEEDFGKPYQQATVKLAQTLPGSNSVLVVINQAEIDGQYAGYWMTFWLYPRQVHMTSHLDDVAGSTADVVVYVQDNGRPALDPSPRYAPSGRMTYPDGTVVHLYHRADR